MKLPLERYRVLDFGTAWAAPMAGQILADMGAQVIKIESRSKMDGLRMGRPIIGDDVAGGDKGLWPELQPVFHGLNRNKWSITVNLKETISIDLIKELVERSDVVVSNYSPGVLERLGLDYENLRQANPDIVVIGMPAAGDTGPLKDILAYAPIVLALSGLMATVGYRDRMVGELQSAWSDTTAALHAAMAATAALRHRNATGRGQYIEVSQWESTTSWLGEAVLDWTMNGREPTPMGNENPRMSPHGAYRCRGDDSWVSIAVATDEEWTGLCQAVRSENIEAAPKWTSDLYWCMADRRIRGRREVDRFVGDWTETHTPEEVTQLLQQRGVAAFPVMNIGDQFMDPGLRSREAWVEMEHPNVGIEWLYGQPWNLSETPGSIRRHAPILGEHNREVFVDLLGFSEEKLRQLVKAQALY